MSLFAISDLHLSTNQNTNKSMEVFGSRWKNYTEKIRQQWNLLVTENDTVVIPGDISWAMNLDEAISDFTFLDSLPGQKIIGKGNHDFWWATAAKFNAFLEANKFSTIKLLYNNALAAEGFIICGSRGWYNDENLNNIPENTDYDKIIRREVIRLTMSLEAGKKLQNEQAQNAEMLVFLHFPPVFRDFRCEEIIDTLKSFGIRRCFYGHIHGGCDFPAVFEDDGIDYRILSADQVKFTPQMIFPL